MKNFSYFRQKIINGLQEEDEYIVDQVFQELLFDETTLYDILNEDFSAHKLDLIELILDTESPKFNRLLDQVAKDLENAEIEKSL